jgi:transmembrane sensor
MQKQELISTLEKIANGTASDEEITVYLKWYNSYAEPEDIWAELNDEPEIFKKQLFSKIQDGIQDAEQPVKQIKLWPRIAVAAAAVAAITLSIWLYYTPRHPEFISGSPLANDIAPGKNTAIITLIDGTVIPLSDAQTGVVVNSSKLTYSDGTQVVQPSLPKGISPGGRESNNQMLTASTPRGGTYQVILPDGTKVWLNADSKISFPVQFSGGIRKILLSGEGYFEVSKDKAHPFVVQTDKQEVIVLGTHFNINAYRDERDVRTTLLEGSVKVSTLSPRKGDLSRGERIENRILKPNQQSILTGSNRIMVANVDVSEAVAWKNGKFRFDNTSLEEVMRQIARWYDVDVVYPNGIPGDTFSGGINRDINASEALKILQIMKVNFKIEGKTIVVSK